jgi:hypothetical protein
MLLLGLLLPLVLLARGLTLLRLGLLNLGLSLLFHLLLMSLNLRQLMILLLPLLSEFLPLRLRSRLIALDAPGSLLLPISIIIPALPVLLKSFVRNSFIVPSVSVPIMVSVVRSPTWVYIKIKTWNTVVIGPTPVRIIRAIPTAFPWAPPPTTPEKQVYIYIRNNVHVVRILYLQLKDAAAFQGKPGIKLSRPNTWVFADSGAYVSTRLRRSSLR